ncbi:MAG: DUF2249 domain-containing protein [Ktedonobacterales bacterium]
MRKHAKNAIQAATTTDQAQAGAATPVSDPSGATTLLDVRPDLERGDDPFNRIIEAAAVTRQGDTLVIVAPFEPAPLYAVLGTYGFRHETACVAPDEWRVRFIRIGTGSTAV